MTNTRAGQIEDAARALLADVRSRYPGEPLRCPHMIRLDELVNGGPLDHAIAYLRYAASQAKDACREEEAKPNMGDTFWRRYWAGYYTGLEAAADTLESGDYEVETLTGPSQPLNLEQVIADTMASGNDITPFEIAVAIRDRFPNLIDDLTT